MAASKHQNEEEKQNNKNYNHPNAVIATSPVRLGRQTRPACTAVNVVVIVLMGFFLGCSIRNLHQRLFAAVIIHAPHERLFARVRFTIYAVTLEV